MKKFIAIAVVALLLVAATLAVWHWRFVEVPGGIVETALTEPLTGWSAEEYNKYEIIDEKDGSLLRLQRDSLAEKTPAIFAWLKPKDSVSGIHFRCDSQWKNVKAGVQGYTIARIAASMRNQQGQVTHTPDFAITSGVGSKDWHHSEAVLLLTPDMVDTGFEISMLGDKGLFEVKNLSVTAVRDRAWVPTTTTAVLFGWLVLCFFVIRKTGKTVPLWRALTASAVIVAAGWFFVFPQPKGLLHPVVKTFSIKGAPQAKTITPPPALPEIVPEPAAAAPPTQQAPAVAPPTLESPVIAHAEKPVAEPIQKTEPAPRSSNAFYKLLRWIDRTLPVAHVGLFIAITLLILIITGHDDKWPLPLALAILSELIPELTDHLGGWDDWADVLQNIAGVAIAIILWTRLGFLQRLSRMP